MAATFISPYPRIVVPSTSFFEYAMQQNPLYPADLAAYVDGLTGETISRRVFEGKCLALASGLRSAHEAGLLPLSRGSTVQVISPSTTLYVTLIYALVRLSVSPERLMLTLDLARERQGYAGCSTTSTTSPANSLTPSA